MKRLFTVLAIVTIAALLGGCVVNINAPTARPCPVPTIVPIIVFVTVTPTPAPAGIPGSLSVATDASYPPFENLDPLTGKPRGFDIDLMDEIGRELNRSVNYTNELFSDLLTDVAAGRFDCAIAAIEITPDRAKLVSFSDQYYVNMGQAIVIRTDSSPVYNVSDLVGHRVGVMKDTVAEVTVEGIPGMHPSDIIRYDSLPDALQAVKYGGVDAAVGDYALVYPYLRRSPGTGTIAPAVVSKPVYFAIAVNKNESRLTAEIDEALARIRADGRYQAIYDKWLG